MKRFSRLILALAMCVAVLYANALAGTVFDEDFFEERHLWDGELVTTQSVAVANGNVYDLLTNGDIYSWNPQTSEYSLYAQVPALPAFGYRSDMCYSELGEAVKIELDKVVFDLIGCEDTLLAINPTNGAIGTVEAAGVTWNDVRLDTSVQMQSDRAYPMSLRYAFVEGDTLYGFYDLAWDESDEAPCRATLLAFDLNTGVCASTDLTDTYAFCQYTPGFLLLLRKDGEGATVLARYELEGGKTTDLALSIPVIIDQNAYDWWSFTEQIGGLAYHPTSDTVYLANVDGLWSSTAGAAFIRHDASEGIWEYLLSSAQAWTLPDGAYVVHSGYVYLMQEAYK